MLDFSLLEYLLLGIVGLVVGVLNAMAGGASVLVYTALMAVGLNPVSAAVTNAWGVTPANLVAQKVSSEKLRDLYLKNWKLLWFSILGTVLGAIALLNMPIEVLEKLVPILLLIASLSVLIPIKPDSGGLTKKQEQAAIFGTGLYCGYFGPGQGVMVAATLARDGRRSSGNLNGLKNFITGYTSLVSNLIYLGSGQIQWRLVLLLAVTSGTGGWIGGHAAGRLSLPLYRGLLLLVGVGASAYFFTKFW